MGIHVFLTDPEIAIKLGIKDSQLEPSDPVVTLNWVPTIPSLAQSTGYWGCSSDIPVELGVLI